MHFSPAIRFSFFLTLRGCVQRPQKADEGG
jgi:hypothetical protein